MSSVPQSVIEHKVGLLSLATERSNVFRPVHISIVTFQFPLARDTTPALTLSQPASILMTYE
jgi:hypothetical protein